MSLTTVQVLSLSTATEETYKLDKYDEGQWGEALRNVELRELTVIQRRLLIDSGRIRPHLNYQLFPFVANKVKSECRLSVCRCVRVYVCCLLYTSPSPRDSGISRMPSSA